MIRCPVCLHDNDEFAITCGRCKGFLQNRIPNLNLFETVWSVLESPRTAFRHIALADHKNFSVLLFGLFGISLSFTGLWYFKLGDRFSTLLDLIVQTLIVGPFVGLAASIVLVLLFHLVARAVGGKAAFRTSYALLAYALTPIVLSLLFVLPIELLTFGMFLFTSNPHPYILKPVSYVLLVGFDGLMSLWSIVLAAVGGAVAHGLSYGRSVAVVVLTLAALSGVFVLVSQQLSAAL
ncbi:MAG: YIP1 family protein [Bacteroidota bacterium]